MDFSVSVRGGGPDSEFFIISTPAGSTDHYVQGRIDGQRFRGKISLGEPGEYWESPERVAVYVATGSAASRISASIQPPPRPPMADWGSLTPAPVPVGWVGVIRRSLEQCGG